MCSCVWHCREALPLGPSPVPCTASENHGTYVCQVWGCPRKRETQPKGKQAERQGRAGLPRRTEVGLGRGVPTGTWSTLENHSGQAALLQLSKTLIQVASA